MIEGKTVAGEAAEEKVVEDTLAGWGKSGSAAVSYWQRHGSRVVRLSSRWGNSRALTDHLRWW